MFKIPVPNAEDAIAGKTFVNLLKDTRFTEELHRRRCKKLVPRATLKCPNKNNSIASSEIDLANDEEAVDKPDGEDDQNKNNKNCSCYLKKYLQNCSTSPWMTIPFWIMYRDVQKISYIYFLRPLVKF